MMLQKSTVARTALMTCCPQESMTLTSRGGETNPQWQGLHDLLSAGICGVVFHEVDARQTGEVNRQWGETVNADGQAA